MMGDEFSSLPVRAGQISTPAPTRFAPCAREHCQIPTGLIGGLRPRAPFSPRRAWAKQAATDSSDRWGKM
jgi:hypothetical protein